MRGFVFWGCAGSVREEDPVRLERERLLRASRCGHHRHLEAVLDQQAQDVLFHAEVVGHHLEALLRTRRARSLSLDATPAPLAPDVGLFAGHFGNEVSPI